LRMPEAPGILSNGKLSSKHRYMAAKWGDQKWVI